MRFFCIVFFRNQHLIGRDERQEIVLYFFANLQRYSCTKFDFPLIICGNSNYCSLLSHVFPLFFQISGSTGHAWLNFCLKVADDMPDIPWKGMFFREKFLLSKNYTMERQDFRGIICEKFWLSANNSRKVKVLAQLSLRIHKKC